MEEGTIHDDLTQFLPYKEKFEEVIACKYANETAKMSYFCKMGHLNLLKSLLQDSDDKNRQDDDKYSIMHCASEHGQFKILEYLVPLWSKIDPKKCIIKLFAPHVNGSEFQDTLFH